MQSRFGNRSLPRRKWPELTSRHFLAWALDRKIDLVHIQPGKPSQNAYVESFNSKLREECLRVSWFQNLFEARRIIANWRNDYNQRRPHSSLNYMTPSEFAAKASRGKDAGQACLKNEPTVFHYWNGPPPVQGSGLSWLAGGSAWRFPRLASI